MSWFSKICCLFEDGIKRLMEPQQEEYFKSLHKLFEIPEINLMMFSLLETYCYYSKVHIYEYEFIKYYIQVCK